MPGSNEVCARDPNPPRIDLLSDLRSGRRGSLERLVPLVYAELRAIAHRRLGVRGRGGTLSTTELVHEAYLKLVDQSQAGIECRFFGGLTEEEIAEALGITVRTVQRDWAKARMLVLPARNEIQDLESRWQAEVSVPYVF